MQEKRLQWIDVAKGLLLLMVVFGHIRGHAYSMGYNNTSIEIIDFFSNVFIPFYMPCFFVITGFCSSFNKPFKKFAVSSFKSIMIPAFFFSFVFSVSYHVYDYKILLSFAKNILLFGGNYWFLPALFLSRLLYWLISKYSKTGKQIAVFCAISFILGFAFKGILPEKELWWFAHVLLMLPFLGIGQWLKHIFGEIELSRFFLYSIIAYSLILIVVFVLVKTGVVYADSYLFVPGITQKLFNINVPMFIPLVLLSVIGSFALLGLSYKINHNKILEFLGKNSLVIYCAQGYVLNNTLSYLKKLSNVIGINYQSLIPSILLILLSFVITVLICSAISWIMNMKHVRVFLGKF